MEWRPLLPVGVEAIEKGAFESPSTKVANFFFLMNPTILPLAMAWKPVLTVGFSSDAEW